MTMQHPIHPDDERLAALAGGDADREADAGLRAHVAACERCRPMVADLQQLRSALAELPDVAPSRPLQLVPPVAAPTPAGGGILRRLAGPFMAAGAALLLVGAVGAGASGIIPGSGGAFPGAAAASAGGAEVDTTTEGSAAGESPAFLNNQGSQASDHPVPTTRDHIASAPSTAEEGAAPPAVSRVDDGVPQAAMSPWLVVLFAGLGLLFAGVAFRVVARAGP
jgi:hypothetical protein